MTLKFIAARGDISYAADALQAMLAGRDDDDDDLPLVGALLVAEFLSLIRSLGEPAAKGHEDSLRKKG